MADIAVFEAKESDLPVCAGLIVAAHNEICEELGFPRNETPDAALERLKDIRFAGGRIYLAREGEAPVGTFALCRVGEDEEAYEISMLSVDPARQRQGIGRAMLERALTAVGALGGACAVCALPDGNAAAKALFAESGFWIEASGRPEGLSCDICIMQRDTVPEPGCGGC